MSAHANAIKRQFRPKRHTTTATNGHRYRINMLVEYDAPE
jgi:hypothetical protein